MSFFEHSRAWYQGESLDMAVLAAVGITLLLAAALFWRLGHTPLGQAMALPLAVVALIFLGAGVSGVVGTPAKIAAAEVRFRADPQAYVQAERARVDGFEALYRYTMLGAALAFALAVAAFALSDGPNTRAIAFALALLGTSALLIDAYSQERAAGYATAIDAQLAADR